jgi:hypothetical protein
MVEYDALINERDASRKELQALVEALEDIEEHGIEDILARNQCLQPSQAQGDRDVEDR